MAANGQYKNIGFIDFELVANLGPNEAIVFERIWFVTESMDCSESWSIIDDGQRWLVTTYASLMKLFTAPSGALLLSERTLKRIISRLEEVKALSVERSSQGIRIAVDFDGLEGLVSSASFARYEQKSKGCQLVTPGSDNLSPPNTEPHENEQLSHDNLSPPDDEGCQSVTPSHDNLSPLAMTTCHPPLYIEESLEESIEDSIPSPDGEEEPMEPAKSPYVAIHRMVYANQDFDAKEIGEVLGLLKGTYKQNGASFAIDVDTLEDYSIWYMLHPDGFAWTKQFPNRGEFIGRFGKFLSWYPTKDNQLKLKLIKDRFPDWRDRLFTGDYRAFQDDVQASLEAKQGRGSRSPFVRTREQRRKAGHST